MTIPRPHLTVRRLMIAVSLAGLVVAGWIEGERRRERFSLNQLHHGLRTKPRLDGGTSAARLAYHRAMSEKYEYAAYYPWLPVWPDPPESE